MSTPRRSGLVFWCSAALAGCAPPAPTAQHTVDEYRADAALRQAQLERCAKDPGTLKDTPDCVNAGEAARLESARSLRALPPVQLPRDHKPYSTPAQGEPPAEPKG